MIAASSGALVGVSAMSVKPSFEGVSDECLIVQEANHRFANHLALLSGFVRLKAADLARQPVTPTVAGVLLLLESLHAQIAATARLHRTLAMDGGRSRADLGEHLHSVCAPLSAMFAGRIAMIEDVSPGCEVGPDRILPLIQIVSEVIINALKHAYPPDHVGTVLIRGRQNDAGIIMIEIVDDGPGLPDGFDVERASGLGFHLIRALTRHLGALVELDSGPAGLCFRLTLPPDAEPL
jgi:two-component sensor histidine kinase